jgi:hypothetical protein
MKLQPRFNGMVNLICISIVVWILFSSKPLFCFYLIPYFLLFFIATMVENKNAHKLDIENGMSKIIALLIFMDPCIVV